MKTQMVKVQVAKQEKSKTSCKKIELKKQTHKFFPFKRYRSVQRYKPCKFGDYDTQKTEWSLVCENTLSTKPYEHQCKYSFLGTIQNYSEKYLSTNTHIDQYEYSFFGQKNNTMSLTVFQNYS